MRYVIIGASAAGLSAAETLRCYDPHGAITIISEEPHPLYSRPLLTYLLSGEVKLEAVWLKGSEYFKDWGFEALLGEAVVGLNPEAHQVRLASGRAVPYDRLLIASGAQARLLGLPGEELAGVFTLRTLADWQRLEADLPGCRVVTVVGAGAVGLKAAEALAQRGQKVILLETESRALPRLLDSVAAALLHQALERLGVELRLNTSPVAVLGHQGRVRALGLAEGRELATEAVLLAVGVTPRVEFLQGTGLNGPQGIAVNPWQQTAHPHIYAAGDCACPVHFLTGQPAYYPIWPAAVAQGRVAGANLAGAALSYPGVLPQNSISFKGFQVIAGGLTLPGESEGCEVSSDLDARRGHYRRLVYRQGRLVGVILVGAVAEAGLYFQAISQQLPLKEGWWGGLVRGGPETPSPGPPP